MVVLVAGSGVEALEEALEGSWRMRGEGAITALPVAEMLSCRGAVVCIELRMSNEREYNTPGSMEASPAMCSTSVPSWRHVAWSPNTCTADASLLSAFSRSSSAPRFVTAKPRRDEKAAACACTCKLSQRVSAFVHARA